MRWGSSKEVGQWECLEREDAMAYHVGLKRATDDTCNVGDVAGKADGLLAQSS